MKKTKLGLREASVKAQKLAQGAKADYVWFPLHEQEMPETWL